MRGFALATVLWISICTSVMAERVVIRPGAEVEKHYLVEDHSALREVSYDPLTPYTRIADGATMSYTYRFALKPKSPACLLVAVSSQFLISASSDGGKTYSHVADMNHNRRVGTYVYVDLRQPPLRGDVILVRFEDLYKQDGWGALLSEILFYNGADGSRMPPRPNNAVDTTNHRYGPYTPVKMNYLAGNFLQCLYDSRYNLLAFQPGERQPIHFVHDTLRSLSALADEDRYTPVVRLELARKLYQGCKGAILPGGEYLFAFKHDSRPIDVRPLQNTPDLALAHKVDEMRLVASVGLRLGDGGAPNSSSDTAVRKAGVDSTFVRTWRFGGRTMRATAVYPPGDADRPPHIDFALDGRGPVQIVVGRLAEKGMWFLPNSWGPEVIVKPDGDEISASQGHTATVTAKQRYLFVRGDNTGAYTFSRAVMVMWDGQPVIQANSVAGGQKDGLFSDIVLTYANDRPSIVRLRVYPFDGYAPDLKTPRAIARNIASTGKLGCGIYDPVVTASSNGLGPDAMAAAAGLFRKYHAPEAAEAEKLAVACMQACIDREKAGVHTEQLYYLVDTPRRLAELGHKQYLPWTRAWGDRILSQQAKDGSFTWLSYQVRMMAALLRAHEITGDPKYREAFDRAAETLQYRDGQLYWNGKLEQYDDFAGAGTFAVFGHIGDTVRAQKALDARQNYIDDRGFSACSDLNPYMLGFSAKGLGLSHGSKLKLGLTEFAVYDNARASKIKRPTAYFVNPYHPVSVTAHTGLPSDR